MGELRSGSVSLAEIVAYTRQTSQTGRLTVSVAAEEAAAGASAVLTFEAGHLIDARRGDETGDDLVYRLLSTRGGSFRFDHETELPPGTERTIARWQERLILATIGALPEEDAAPAAPAPPLAAPAPSAARSLPAGAPLPAARPGKGPGMRAAAPPAIGGARPALAAWAALADQAARRFRSPLPPPHAPAVPTVLQTQGAGFMELLEQLELGRFSGYLLWTSDTADGRLLVLEGQIIEADWYERRSAILYTQKRAMRRFTAAALSRADSDGPAGLTCHPLDGALIWSYTALFNGLDRPQDRNLHGVVWEILMERAVLLQLTGCVQVTVGLQTAIRFLGQGAALGDYVPGEAGLELAPGRPAALTAEPASRVDVFTARDRAALDTLNQVAWPVEQIAAALSKAAVTLLGARGGQVVKLIEGASHDPQALRAACTRARQVTRIFIGPTEYDELSRRMDHLLAYLRT